MREKHDINSQQTRFVLFQLFFGRHINVASREIRNEYEIIAGNLDLTVKISFCLLKFYLFIIKIWFIIDL